MTGLSDIVNVTITRDYMPISSEGFGTELILGTHKNFSDRIHFYNKLSDLADDHFAETSLEYLAAQATFSQNPRPVQIAIGRRSTDDAELTVVTAADNTDYITTINGTPFLFNSGVGATVASIATGLVAAINLGAEPVTASDGVGGVYTIAADVANIAYSLAVDVNQSISAYQPSDTITNDIEAVQAESNDWYVPTETLHDAIDVLELAEWSESHNKLYGTSSSDTNIIDQSDLVDTTSIAALLKAKNYARTFSIYHNALKENEFLECAWAGKMLPTDPGSATWALKNMNAVTADALTSNQSKNARDKFCNTYELIAQIGVTRDGKVADNEYIDIIRGVDWLVNTIQLAMYSMLLNSPKIPYTQNGLAIVESILRTSLNQGIRVGFLASDPAPYITIPKIQDIPVEDKQNRILNNVEFQATPAGAIQQLVITGRLSYQI